MEQYDSSIETLKHIKTVAKYIDLLSDSLNTNITNNVDMTDDINKITLIDMLQMLIHGIDIPLYDDLFRDINNNSNIYKLGNIYTNDDMLLRIIEEEFIERKVDHDRSKLEEPEKHEFDIWTPRINEATLGTPMYDYFLNELRAALQHHYRYNRHHPEHFGNGIHGMTIMDISEMLCDWIATSERHEDGDIYKAIEILSNRFDYDKPMVKVLSNTCDKYLKSK